MNVEPEMPVFLKRISVCVTIILVVLAAWIWYNDLDWGRVVAVLLFITASPPVATFIVLEVANYISGGELKRTGKMKRRGN